MPIAVPLSNMVTLARAGALDHAWGKFSAASYDHDNDDPTALTVKGRLLEDYALRASDEAERFHLDSPDWYHRPCRGRRRKVNLLEGGKNDDRDRSRRSES